MHLVQVVVVFLAQELQLLHIQDIASMELPAHVHHPIAQDVLLDVLAEMLAIVHLGQYLGRRVSGAYLADGLWQIGCTSTSTSISISIIVDEGVLQCDQLVTQLHLRDHKIVEICPLVVDLYRDLLLHLVRCQDCEVE